MSMLLLVLLKNGQGDVCTGRHCSAKEAVFVSLPNFCCLGKSSGLNRIGHPDWVKLCVELNCVPNQNTFCYSHLAEDHGQYAAVYTHMENLAATSSNADIAGRAKKIHKHLKDLVFTAFCHFVSNLFGKLTLLSLKLQANNLILPVANASIKDCMETVTSMKEEYIPGGMYEKFILCIKEQQSENLQDNPKFQGVEMTRSPVCEAKEKLKKHVGLKLTLQSKSVENKQKCRC